MLPCLGSIFGILCRMLVGDSTASALLQSPSRATNLLVHSLQTQWLVFVLHRNSTVRVCCWRALTCRQPILGSRPCSLFRISSLRSFPRSRSSHVGWSFPRGNISFCFLPFVVSTDKLKNRSFFCLTLKKKRKKKAQLWRLKIFRHV